MDLESEDIELIKKYLDGKLTGPELQAFNYRLEDDREFARKFRIRKAFPSLLPDNSQYRQTVKTEKISDETTEKPVSSKISRKTLWIFSVGVFLIITTVLFILFRTSDRNQAIHVIRNDTGSGPFRLLDRFQISQEEKLSIEESDVAIVLISPAIDESFSRNAEIVFSWKQKTDSLTNFFIRSEISHKMLWWRGIKPGIRAYRLPPRTFLPGKYYWYVGNREIRRTFIITE